MSSTISLTKMPDDRLDDEPEVHVSAEDLPAGGSDEADPLEEDPLRPDALQPDPLEHDQGLAAEEIHPASGEPEAAPPLLADTDKRWYIIHAYSGFEQKVAESLRTRSQAFGFAERLGQILIPTEEVIELRNGKKVTSKRLLYPGHVLV